MPQVGPNSREDPTTESLCRLLRQNRSTNDLPFRIDIQMVELDPAAGQDQGRLDIVFSPPVNREDIYFCLECKRLNVVNSGQLRSYAREYVVFGMVRFVRGQYASVVRHGGMLGYVLNGDLSSAMASVSASIKSHHIDLGMTPPGDMLQSSVWPEDGNIKETHHTRNEGLGAFQIQHIFVPSAAPARATADTKPAQPKGSIISPHDMA
jgi:hypothetical protein